MRSPAGRYIFTHSSETRLLNPNAPQMFDEGNGLFSTVILDWIEWEGPLETEAEKVSAQRRCCRPMTQRSRWLRSICNASPSGLGGGR
jgi:hypothetical protein